MGEHIRAGDLEIWTEQVGEGPASSWNCHDSTVSPAPPISRT
jgi:hypothetical protein